MASLLALTGLNLLNYVDRQVLPAVLPRLQEDFHLDDSQAGTIGTAFMLGYFLTSPFFGYLGDRLRRGWLIAGGVLVWSLATVLTGVATSFALLVFFRVFVGFGEASYGTLSPSWIADLYPPPRRNTALSVFYVAIPVGAALGQILGGRIEKLYGWHAAFFVAGAPGLLLALGVLALREPARGASEPARPAAAPADRPPGLRAYAELFRHRPYLLVVAGYAAQTFAMGGFAYWGAKFLVSVHGMSLQSADDFFGTSLVVSGLIATVAGGLTATAWQRRHPGGYAWVLALSALAAVPFAFGAFALTNLLWAKVALVAAMFLLFFSTGPVNTLILETVPVGMRASAMAASIFAIHLFGDVWSPKIVGRLSVGLHSLRAATLWTLPGALVACAGFWLCLALQWSRPKSPAAAS